MLGYAKLLRSGMLNQAESVRALEAIERNTNTQTQIVNDILEVSRIITGKLRLDARQIKPVEAIAAAIEAVRPAVEAKGISLECSLDASAGPIMGDPDRLQQIAWNLLSNAVKFTPQGGSMEVRLERKANFIQLEVRDTGVGIPSEFLRYAFDRFSQADSSMTRSFGGLGLGLAIVRHLVELHGGTVKVMSAGKDQGATFTVTLPFFVTHSNVAPVKIAGREAVDDGNHREGTPVYPILDGLKLLVVDDDEDTREMVTMIFQRCGSEVRAASNASEAMETFYGWRPEVMVCDIGMPGEDGYSLISRVRAAESDGAVQTPAVALTGYARSEDRARALAAGYQLHIAKPIDPIELANAIIKLTKGGPLAGGTGPLAQDVAG